MESLEVKETLEVKESGLTGAGNSASALSRATSRFPDITLLQLPVTFSRLENHHPGTGVFARMCFIITRLVQCFHKYCLHREHFKFALETSWCHPAHRSRLTAPP